MGLVCGIHRIVVYAGFAREWRCAFKASRAQAGGTRVPFTSIQGGGSGAQKTTSRARDMEPVAMTRVFGLLSWYSERVDWLAASVASIAPHIDHLVAVDGAYSLYPSGKASSGPEQAETIREVCRAAGIGCTLHVPQTTWQRNECEKRTAMFRLAESISGPDDWYWVIDADEMVLTTGCDYRAVLAQTTRDVAEVTFCERNPPLPDPNPMNLNWPEHHEYTIRCMFRAIRGLEVVGKHYCYRTPDGRSLWGDPPLEHPEDLSLIRMEHRSKFRSPERRDAAKTYYRLRDEMGIESSEVPTVV